ncbi:MAG: glycosyltransferase family 2 protein [Thermodesulfobacteriota bacterium]
MSDNIPKVSIGMPVYNAENYIEQAIDSILDQTYTDFELIISDNASNDRTEEICRSYFKKDNRIRYFRNDINFGASRNFNTVFDLAKGEYFKWAAHDDTIAPDYLSKCVEILENDSTTVFCYTKTKIVNEFDGDIYNYEVEMNNVNSDQPHRRFGDLILISHWGIEIFGLFRTRELRKTKLIASYPGSDRTLMAEISLLGRFHEIPEHLFFSRDHSGRSVRNGSVHSRMNWFDTSKSNQTVFPHWRLYSELFRCVKASTINWTQKGYCYLSMGKWLFVNFNSARLLIDLVMAVEPRSWQWSLKIRDLFKKKHIMKKV